jgi:hypothetical protein
MTKSTSGEREQSATEAPVSLLPDEVSALKTPAQMSLDPSQETGGRGANIPYIDPPTIPAGMTVETYRHVREHRKPHGIRRLVAHRAAGKLS